MFLMKMIMKNSVKEKVLLGYSDVFEENEIIDDLLQGISKLTLIKISSYLSSTSNNLEDTDLLFDNFFSTDNDAFKKEVKYCIFLSEKKHKCKFSIVNTMSSLTLFEHAYKNNVDYDTLTSTEIEINVFKVYLLINESLTTKRERLISDLGSEDTDSKAKLFFGLTYADSDLINYDLNEMIICQFVKSLMLFELLEKSDKSQNLLREFIIYFDCCSWQEYLQKILPVFFSVSIDKTGWLLCDKSDDNYKQNISFLEHLSLSDNSKLVKYDFGSLRAKPLYRISENEFCIIHPLFVIEMLHKGLYFKLNEINESLDSDKEYSNFRSFYGESFSENYLLYNILDRIYGNSSYIRYSGQAMKEKGQEAEPDYYVRNGNKIFLFESKDVLINAEVKTSFDYERLETVLVNRFYYSTRRKGKRSSKAILQLIANIKRIFDKDITLDTKYKKDSVKIYPILIIHHHQFDVSGLNVILNNWFSGELQKLAEDGYKVNGVKPMTVVNIDTFIYNQDLFMHKVLKLDRLIDEYHKYIKKNCLSLNGYIPFSVFLSNKIQKLGCFVTHTLIEEKGFNLSNDLDLHLGEISESTK